MQVFSYLIFREDTWDCLAVFFLSQVMIVIIFFFFFNSSSLADETNHIKSSMKMNSVKKLSGL